MCPVVRKIQQEESRQESDGEWQPTAIQQADVAALNRNGDCQGADPGKSNTEDHPSDVDSEIARPAPRRRHEQKGARPPRLPSGNTDKGRNEGAPVPNAADRTPVRHAYL